jgi:hypothetical protein
VKIDDETKPGSERSFGIVFSVVFALIFLYPLINDSTPYYWSGGVSLFIIIVTFVKPTLLQKPNFLWFRFGLILGAVVSPVVLGLVFLTTVVPIGIVFRLTGYDPLQVKKRSSSTYWIEREDPPQSMQRMF